jgi:hypothetical protein
MSIRGFRGGVSHNHGYHKSKCIPRYLTSEVIETTLEGMEVLQHG